jgi:hypothetical protein
MLHPAHPSSLVRYLAACALAASLTASADARANPRDDGATAETLGQADAVRASVWGPAALVWNPAGLLRVPALLAQANYDYLDGEGGHRFSAGLLDARTSPFSALGVQYAFVDATRDGVRREGHQVRLGLGTGYRAGDFGLFAGVGARWLGLSLTPAAGPATELDAWTVDLGLMFDFADRVRFGAAAQNLVALDHADARRALGLGLSFVFDGLEIGATLDLDLSGLARTPVGDRRTITAWALGADYGLGEAIRLRAGLAVDALTERERLTTGLGWSTPTVGLDLGWSTAVVDPADMVFAVTLRLLPSR